jgi:hypothetical protein
MLGAMHPGVRQDTAHIETIQRQEIQKPRVSLIVD